MKKNIVYNVIFNALLLFPIFSCKNFCLVKAPEIVNPQYSIYHFEGEKGYNVSFTLKSDAEPVAIVFNKIKQKINPENKQGLNYKIRVIAETRKIENYKIEGTALENGIIFKVNNKEVLKAVKFSLK